MQVKAEGERNMRLPGFSAEASVDLRGTSPSTIAGRDQATGVIPQLPKVLRCAVALGVADAVCKVGSVAACISAEVRAESICSD